MLRTSRCEAFCSRASRSGPPSGRLASPHVPEGEWRGRAGTRSSTWGPAAVSWAAPAIRVLSVGGRLSAWVQCQLEPA